MTKQLPIKIIRTRVIDKIEPMDKINAWQKTRERKVNPRPTIAILSTRVRLP